jgi:hypothetical protein
MLMDEGENPIKVQTKFGLEKFNGLNIMDRQRVLMEVDKQAKQKGYVGGQAELKEKRPYIWDQMVAQVTMQKFS